MLNELFSVFTLSQSMTNNLNDNVKYLFCKLKTITKYGKKKYSINVIIIVVK